MTSNYFCLTIFGLIFGVLVVFNGYTIFRSILPLLGAIFGFFLGLQTMFFVFGVGLLSTLTSLIVGTVLGVVFAGLSYLFYRVAISLIAASLGYAIGVSIMQWIGLGSGIITWIVGILLGAAFIYITFRFKLEKYVIVVETALIGSAIIVSTLLLGMETTSPTIILNNPIQELLTYSPLWAILFVVVAVAGVVVQIKKRNFKDWEYTDIHDPVRDYNPMDFNQ